MVFNLSLNAVKAQEYFNQMLKKGEVIEILKVKQTRTNQQNKALHLFFTMVAKELNDLGIPFVYHGLKGMEMEMQWTPELFKQFTWKPIQQAMFGIESTTKLKRDQIDPIFDVINKFFADRGVSIQFPNRFDFYLNFYNQ